MSENFELAVATVRNLGNYFPGGGPEIRHTRILRTLLNEAGVACYMNTTNAGADILSKDFVTEGKNDLLSSSVLHTLTGQIGGYVREGNLQILVVIYGDASRTLLSELNAFKSHLEGTSGIFRVLNIRVVVMGKVVNNGPANVHPSANDNSVFNLFNL